MSATDAYFSLSGFELLATLAVAAVLVVVFVRAGALGENRRLFEADEELF